MFALLTKSSHSLILMLALCHFLKWQLSLRAERGAEVKIVQIKSAARTDLDKTKSRLELCKNLLSYRLVILQKYSLKASESPCWIILAKYKTKVIILHWLKHFPLAFSKQDQVKFLFWKCHSKLPLELIRIWTEAKSTLQINFCNWKIPILGPWLGNLILLLLQLLLIGVERWGKCHLWVLGKGHTSPKPVAGPELVFSASCLCKGSF